MSANEYDLLTAGRGEGTGEEVAGIPGEALGHVTRRRVAAGRVDPRASSGRPTGRSRAAIGGAYVVTRAAQALLDQLADQRDEFRMHAHGAGAHHLQPKLLA